MKKTIYCVAAFLIFMVAGCSEDGPENRNIQIDLTRSESEAVKAVNDFTFDLMRASEKRFGKDMPNYFMSPQSAAWCVAMVANGAEDGSQTQREIIDVLHLGADATLQDINDYSSKLISSISSRKGEEKVNLANAVYYKSYIGIKQDYLKSMKTFYGAENFMDPTNGIMDSWVENMTGGAIKLFASKYHLDRRSFGVINTMSFTAKWLTSLERKTNKKFRNADGTISEVNMADACNYNSQLSHDEICHLLKLDFSGRGYAMYFIIPTDGHDIDDVSRHIDGERWRNLLAGLYPEKLGLVRFPILHATCDLDFKDVIQDMGVKKAFSNRSELTGIADTQIIMSAFDQTTVFKLDEGGVETSTTTHFSDSSYAYFPETKEFLVDEPFYYFITEESTGAILFAGKISQL